MMVSSRVASAARQAGVEVSIAPSPGDLKERLSDQTRLVMIDLSQPGWNIADAVSAIRTGAKAATIIAFGPHVDEELLASARSADCDVVMSNGQFHRESAELLRRYAVAAS
jgi:DNA-binding response OmpR family regulator